MIYNHIVIILDLCLVPLPSVYLPLIHAAGYLFTDQSDIMRCVRKKYDVIEDRLEKSYWKIKTRLEKIVSTEQYDYHFYKVINLYYLVHVYPRYFD